MVYQYSLSWLTDLFDRGEVFKYLFFWGHSGNGPVGKHCFSQWYDLPFVVDDVVYKTAEHWMMAQKALLFGDTESFQKIVGANRPGEAKDLGRRVQNFDEQLWNDQKYDIVVRGNFHKFGQHPQHLEFLLQTGDRVLVEASPVDRIWGIGLAQDTENIDNPHFWNGQNLLGFALMEVRSILNFIGDATLPQNMPPLPWEIHPKTDPLDMFWIMGKGEDVITQIAKYFYSLSPPQQMLMQLTHPAPLAWQKFYEE